MSSSSDATAQFQSKQTPLKTGFDETSKAEDVIKGVNVTGKNIVITGGHSGIGLETTRVFSLAGANIIIGARNVEAAKKTIQEKNIKNVEVMALDLAEPKSIEEFAKFCQSKFKKIDILVLNAGIMGIPLSRNSAGYEMQFATNHLGHFLLTGKLWSELKAAGKARVVCLTSSGHAYSKIQFNDVNFNTTAYDKWLAYGQSKTANALFAVHLDKIGQPFGIRAFAVHPGWVGDTNLMKFTSDDELTGLTSQLKSAGLMPFVKTSAQGAATSVWAATSPMLFQLGGVYCTDCNIAPLMDASKAGQFSGTAVHQHAVDPTEAEKLFELSEKLVQFKWPNQA